MKSHSPLVIKIYTGMCTFCKQMWSVFEDTSINTASSYISPLASWKLFDTIETLFYLLKQELKNKPCL